MKPVVVRRAGDLAVESAAPERRRAAPSVADVVDHMQFVLDHIRVGPDCLVGIARKLAARRHCGEERGRIADLVAAGRP